MKISNKQTDYILIRAFTDSEWDYCDFALIRLSEEWRKAQSERLEIIKPFANDFMFHSLCFHDASVYFCQTNDNEEPEIEELLANKSWAFVELDDNEEENLVFPENDLIGYKLVIYRNAMAIYEAFGKHTNEDFWTDTFSLYELIGQVKGVTDN